MNIPRLSQIPENKRRTVALSLALLLLVVGGLVSLQDIEHPSSTETPVVATSDKEATDLGLGQYSELARAGGAGKKAAGGQTGSAVKGCSLSLALTSTQNGDQQSYAMNISDVGTQQCKNATVSVYYADDETFVSSNPKASASNYYWKFGNIQPGASVSVGFVTAHQASSGAGVEATQACATADNASADACAHATSGASVTPTPVAGTPVTPPVPTPVLSTSATNNSGEYGTWVWDSPLQMSQSYESSVIDFASANGINVLYVTVDDYLDIAALPAGTNKDTKSKSYMDALQTFVSAANKKGIAVDAEAGWRDWGESGQEYKAFALIDFANSYNASHSAKLRGIQYDVESYLLPTYENNKGPVLKNFVQLVGDITAKMSGSDLKLGIVIPHFYDDAQKWTPAISYNGQTDFTFNHLLRILDTKPGSSLIIMAYRNSAGGDDSSVSISNTEVTEASAGGHSTKVIVAQETGNVDPSYVTFFGLTKAAYLKQVAAIRSTYANSSAFGGIAVDYIDPFMQLK